MRRARRCAASMTRCDVDRGRAGSTTPRSRIADGSRKSSAVIRSPLGQHHRLQDGVLQLAHVAGPGVRVQRRFGLRRERADGLAVLHREHVEEVAREQRNVVAPLAQRRHAQPHDVQAVEEIFAEAPGSHVVFEIAVRRRDDSHVDRLHGRAADHRHRAFLHEAQQLRLHFERQLADLVEEDGAAVGLRQASRRCGARRR